MAEQDKYSNLSKALRDNLLKRKAQQKATRTQRSSNFEKDPAHLNQNTQSDTPPAAPLHKTT